MIICGQFQLIGKQPYAGQLFDRQIINYIISNSNSRVMQQNFSSKKFREALSVLNNSPQSLQPFLGPCLHTRMDWILTLLEDLYDCLHHPNLSLSLSYNSLFAVKALLDTGALVLVNLIEIYLLPRLAKIASFDLYGVSQRRGFCYFLDKGFQGRRNELQYFGHNFIRMANQLLVAAAHIKPFALVENEETKEPSAFSKAVERLKLKGVEPYKYNKFYSQKNLEDSRLAFRKSLNGYSQASSKCGSFYASIVRNYLKNKADYYIPRREMHMNKVFKDGDVTICKQVLRECFTSLQSPDLNQRKKALTIINDFVKWGDILVAYAINYLGVADEVIKEIADPHERSTGSQRARALLSRYGNSGDEKFGYYNELLKSLEFWSRCFPFSLLNPNQPSEMKLAFVLLQQKLDIEFPEFLFDINESLSIFEYYSRQKQVRNERLLLVFQQNAYRSEVIPTLLPSMMNARMVSKKMSIVDQEESFQDLFGQFANKSSFDHFKEDLLRIKKIVQGLAQDQHLVKRHSTVLREFVNDFDAKIIEGNFNEREMDYLIGEGAPLVERVEDLMPVLEKYNKGYLSYPQLRSYLNSYSEQSHSGHIEEIKLRKRETALMGLGLKKEKTMEQFPNLVLPYTESEDQLEPSFYFKNRLDEMHRLESNANALFQVNEEEMMHTKRSEEGKGMVDMQNIKHLESVDNFIELPRMTSLESQMNRNNEAHNNSFGSAHRNSHPNNSSNPNSNPGSHLPTKTNFEVMEKYGGGVMKITELHAEDEFDHSNSNLNNRGSFPTESGQIYLSVQSPAYTGKDLRKRGSKTTKSNIVQRLDKFMEVSSAKQESNRDYVEHSHSGESSLEEVRKNKSQNPLKKVRSHQQPQTMRLASEVERRKDKPYFNRTTSDIIEESQQDSTRKVTLNPNSSRNKQTARQEKQEAKVSNQGLKSSSEMYRIESSHRKSSSMDNINSNPLDQRSINQPISEPENVYANSREKILTCLSPRQRPKTDQDITTKEEEYEPRGRVGASFHPIVPVYEGEGASHSGTSSQRFNYDIGNQIFVQRGFYKEKQGGSISSGSRISEAREKNKPYTKI